MQSEIHRGIDVEKLMRSENDRLKNLQSKERLWEDWAYNKFAKRSAKLLDMYERSHSKQTLSSFMSIWKSKWNFVSLVRANVGHRATGKSIN